MSEMVYETVGVEIVDITEKEVLIVNYAGVEIWVPKSVIKHSDKLELGFHKIQMACWFMGLEGIE